MSEQTLLTVTSLQTHPSYVVTNERLAKKKEKKGITLIYGKVFYPVPLCSQICKFFLCFKRMSVCVCVKK